MQVDSGDGPLHRNKNSLLCATWSTEDQEPLNERFSLI